MKSGYLRIVPLSVIVALIFAGVPSTVFAALGITSVLPGQVVNDVSTNITVTGTDFISGSVVLLDGYGALSTNFQNASVLIASVPAGIPTGMYTVAVSTGSGSVSCSGCLSVVAPTPVPATSTPAPLPFTRPQFVVHSSKIKSSVQTGGNVTLKVVMENAGNATAYSTQVVFTSTDLVPTKNGGVAIVGVVAADREVDVSQEFYVSAQIFGQSIIVTDLTVTYYDENGTSYSDKFTLSIPVSAGVVSSSSVAATATPTDVKSSQLVITDYSSSVDPLQPGEQFALKMKVQNVGNVKAQRITLIVGGGSSGTSEGTPQPGGVSGGGGDFANFAPVGASNVQSLGDLEIGGTIQVSQNLIVNVSTNPGAYPIKMTFSYLNDKGEVINDEQVITLLVYGLPNMDVSFYRSPDPFFVGQIGVLPVQVVNLSKRLSVLGNIKVSASSGLIENGTSLVGSLDAGGYFTLDALFTPEQSGLQSLDIVIEYVDDFNQPRTIIKKMDIEVLEAFDEPTPDPSMSGGGDGLDSYTAEETSLHKIFRFIKGLFGLDSSWPVWQPPGGQINQDAVQPIVPAPGG
jgi:hypothetical protein